MDKNNLEILDNIVSSSNDVRDQNIGFLQGLIENAESTKLKVEIIKAIDDMLKSKESSVFTAIKASLMNSEVKSNVDYKQAAVDMLKAISPNRTVPGTVDMPVDINKDLEEKFSKMDSKILEGELTLE
jgi:predicted nucleotide-binding protein (sugar kinase/HSP70/actin superfamily)